MHTINVLAVLGDARSISQQFSTRRSAASTVVAWAADEFYTRAPIVAVYVYEEGRPLERTTVEALRAELHPAAALMVEALTIGQAALRRAEGLAAAPTAVDVEVRPEPRPSDALDQERIEERARILYEVDAQECTGCGAPAPPEVANDPEWFIDSEGHRDDTGQPYEVAIIRCPGCR